MTIEANHAALQTGGALQRWVLTLLLLLVGVGSLAWGQRWILNEPNTEHVDFADFQVDHHPTASVLGVVLIVAAVVFNRLHVRYFTAARDELLRFAQTIDALSPRARWIDLLLVSILGLFLEVALIRWHGTEFRACAYLKNITLLACFLGLGLGFARARRPLVSFPVALVLLTAQVLFMDILSLMDADRAIHNPVAWEVFWGLGSITRQLQTVIFYGFFAALFITTIVIFVPIGQLTGRLMNPAAPIASYTVNIIGSIAGVVFFAAVSYLWLPPSLWFGLAGILALWLARHSRGGIAVGGGALIALVAWLGYEPRSEVRDIYSPYQRLEIRPDVADLPEGVRVHLGTSVAANKTYYMQAFNLADDFVKRWKDDLLSVKYKSLAYNLPYRLGRAPKDVLIVGAGAGNDIAAAVRHEATHIAAVEIDPAIQWIGRTYHPESPYQSPAVRAINNDARNYMKAAKPESYDLIVFGLLDSHTLLSGMAAIRLDNFVYTLESMKEARRLLRPGGRVCLSFALGPENPFTARMYGMLADAFGHPPRTFTLQGNDTLFAIGNTPQDVVGDSIDPPESTPLVADAAARLKPPPATDDWPFPFLPGRTWKEFPRPYLYLIGMLAALSILIVLGTAERGSTFSPHFFFLGGAFLLIETKGITELALVFGTTWIVTSVVITAILVLILIANWFVSLVRPQNIHLAYIGLFASLLLGYFIPVETLLRYSRPTAAFASAGLLCLPLFFAGIIFATSLLRAPSLPSAFASNLMGAILGGLCEYSSMSLGFRNLYLVGLGIYFLSWLFLPRRAVAVAVTAPA